MFRSFLRGSAVLAGLSALAVFGGATAQAASVSLSQTGGLGAGQSISVSVSGLAPNLASVAVGQCTSQVSGPGDCNLGGSILGRADGEGNWQASRDTITVVGSVGGVDCASAPGACTIAVTSLTDPTNIIASIPLTFG
ncbi:neocarzinostatin apoprotein domain-containing protein [Nocardia sp. NBC_01503]|uniref:neocarzinostatin apoprotein domain-containing protein n=1 Tax=Nocardia sp. NBC_01503 TaxID=2975997 RepID=UPI002E7BE236|nr:neocarzinostatin apoprotein domain-containing protein [Nocardia sp. NBC_01503]WTL30894.1 neocarzinostatin apoprotein domain-containing protein [Nocardia sp. NBC_01503]